MTEQAENKNLVACKSCGGEMGKYAKKCPHCGEPNFAQSKKGCLIVASILGALIILIALVVALTPGPPLEYTKIADMTLPPAKFQIDVAVDLVDGKLPPREKLLALAAYIADNYQERIGQVKRWWVSYHLAGHTTKDHPFVVIQSEDGKVDLQFVPQNLPEQLKGLELQ